MGQALITFFFGRLIGEEASAARRRPSNEPHHSNSATSFSTGISSSGSSSGSVPTSSSAQEPAPPPGDTAAASGQHGGGSFSSNLLNRKPTKMEDFEISSCYSCSVPFDMLVRRHHCRRCWNIYCQKCSSQRNRVLLFGELKPVRLCDGCCKDTPAENYFFERHLPLLLEGTTLAKVEQNNGLLSSARWSRRQQKQQKQAVHLRVTPDLSALEETEDKEEPRSGTRGGTGGGGGSVALLSSEGPGVLRGVTRYHLLNEVESVDAAAEVTGWGGGGCEEDGSSAALVIRLRGKGQLKLEACNPNQRDRWVSALAEAVRLLRAPCLADSVEQERWQRKEDAAAEAQRLENARRRRDNEASRAKMAVKYGLDPSKYASRGSDDGEGMNAAPSGSGSGRIRQSAARDRQPLRTGNGRSDDNVAGFEGGSGVLKGATRYQALAGLAR